MINLFPGLPVKYYNYNYVMGITEWVTAVIMILPAVMTMKSFRSSPVADGMVNLDS